MQKTRGMLVNRYSLQGLAMLKVIIEITYRLLTNTNRIADYNPN